MRFKSVVFLYFLLFFSLSSNITYALSESYLNIVYQDDSIIDESKLEEIKNDEDYDYSVEEKQTNWWTDFKEWLAIQWQRLFGEPFDPDSFWGKFFEVLPYIVLTIAVILLVWFIARSNPGNQIMRQHRNSRVILTEEEELLMKRNLDKLAQEATDEKNYRLAVRYMYLNCIKRLDIKNIIRYANDKTNYEYIVEIQFAEISKSFKTLTLAYEQIWYGQLVFDEAYFQQFNKEYEKFHQNLEDKQYAKA